MVVRPSRRVLTGVVAANVAGIATWAAIHARGWPFGPLPARIAGVPAGAGGAPAHRRHVLAPGGEAAPAPGGCLTRWHTHTNACMAAGEGIVAEVGADGSCPEGSEQRETMQMLHTWVIHVDDPFGDSLDRDTLVAAVRAELGGG